MLYQCATESHQSAVQVFCNDCGCLVGHDAVDWPRFQCGAMPHGLGCRCSDPITDLSRDGSAAVRGTRGRRMLPGPPATRGGIILVNRRLALMVSPFAAGPRRRGPDSVMASGPISPRTLGRPPGGVKASALEGWATPALVGPPTGLPSTKVVLAGRRGKEKTLAAPRDCELTWTEAGGAMGAPAGMMKAGRSREGWPGSPPSASVHRVSGGPRHDGPRPSPPVFRCRRRRSGS